MGVDAASRAGRLARATLALATLAMALGNSAAAAAGCSRPIKVLAGSARQIDVDGRRISGALGGLMERLARETGCEFQYVEAQIARGVVMLAAGEIDLIPAAAQAAERDRHGEFIPFAHARVAAIGLTQRLAEIGPLDAKLSGNFTVSVFRGADYGPAYRDLVASLEQQKRLENIAVMEAGLKMLLARRADVIVSVPVALIGSEPAPELVDKLQAVTLEGIPRITAGFYLSRRSLPAADAAILRGALRNPGFLKRVYLSQVSQLPAWARSAIQPAD